MLVGEVFARMGLDERDYKKGLDRLEGYTEKRATTLGGIFNKAFSVTLGIGLAQGFRVLKNSVSDFLMTAAQTETFNVAMQSVARSVGTNIDLLEQQKRSIQDLGVAEQEATKILTRFMQAQLDTADAMKIVRIAQDAGTIAGLNSSDAANQMVEAIAKLRPELLNAFGFTRNLNDIYGDYAKTVGKTASQLTEVDKKQAMVNYIFSEGEKIAGSYEAAMGTFGKKLGSMEKLMLPKQLMQELKTALAGPVLLPVAGAILDGIITRLEQIKSWALDNKDTLQMWGQTAVNVLSAIGTGFSWVTGLIKQNWAMIKFAATALLTYAVAAKAINIAGVAVRGLTLLLWALRGHAFSSSGAFGALAASVRTYQAASIGAAGTTKIFTGALAALRGALYAIHTALGPVGWALIALSLLVAGGMSLWNKYTQSLQKTPKLSNKVEDSTTAVNEAINDQAEALEKAGKAAAKNLQPFDEINQLQNEMATGTDYLDAINDALNLGAEGLSMPPMDFDEFLDSLEEVKPSFRGFLDWIIAEWFEGWDWWEMLLLMLGPFPAIGMLLYKNWDKIIEIFNRAIDQVGILLESKWSPLIVGAFNPFLGLIHFIRLYWDKIIEIFNRAIDQVGILLESKWSPLIVGAFNPFLGLIHFIRLYWDKIKEVFNRAIDQVGLVMQSKWGPLITGILISPFAGIITLIANNLDKIKRLFNFNLSLPKIKIPRFSVSWSTDGFWGNVGQFLGMPGKPIIDVTWLAKGGIVSSPTLFGAGEAGREAVLPLDRNTGWMDELADRLATTIAHGGGGSDESITINLYVDKSVLAKITAKSLQDLQRQSGTTLIPV